MLGHFIHEWFNRFHLPRKHDEEPKSIISSEAGVIGGHVERLRRSRSWNEFGISCIFLLELIYKRINKDHYFTDDEHGPVNNKVPLKPVLKRKQGQQHTYNPNVKSTIIDIKKTHSASAKIITENPLDNIPLDNKGPRVVQNTKQGKSNIAAGPSVNIVEPKNSKVIHPIRAKRISKQIEKAIPGIQVKTIVAPLEALLNN